MVTAESIELEDLWIPNAQQTPSSTNNINCHEFELITGPHGSYETYVYLGLFSLLN